MSNSVVWSTFLTTIKAVSTVFLIYAGGYVLVKTKIIDRKGVALLASLSNYFFIPALLLVRLSGTLSLETFKYAWPLTVIGLGTLLLNLLLSFLYLPLAQPTQEFRPWFLFGITLPNTVALPLVLIASICNQIEFEIPPHYIETEAFGGGGNSTESQFLSVSQCVDIGELYIFLYSILITLLVWIVGVPILDLSTSEPSLEDENVQPDQIVSIEDNSDEIEVHHPRKILGTKHESRLIYPIILKQLLQPAVALQFVGLFIGLTAPIQNLFYGQGAILSSVTSAVQIVAAAALSVINLIMASSLSFKLVELDNFKTLFGNEERVGVSSRTLFSFLFGRMLIIPAIELGIIYSLRDKLIPNDKLMLLIILLELANPTANFCILIAQILKRSRAAEMLALCILPQYIFGVFTITGFTFVCLLLAGVN